MQNGGGRKKRKWRVIYDSSTIEYHRFCLFPKVPLQVLGYNVVFIVILLMIGGHFPTLLISSIMFIKWTTSFLLGLTLWSSMWQSGFDPLGPYFLQVGLEF